MDWLTKAALLKAERILGYELSITQGSYNGGRVKASGNTHNGGGVIDLLPWDGLSKVRVLRRCGFIAFFRPRLVRDGKQIWPDHIHAVQMGNKRLDPSAERQVHSFHAGRDGLASNGPDPHPWPVNEFVWPYGGVVGLARWRRDQLRGPARKQFLERLLKVTRGK